MFKTTCSVVTYILRYLYKLSTYIKSPLRSLTYMLNGFNAYQRWNLHKVTLGVN